MKHSIKSMIGLSSQASLFGSVYSYTHHLVEGSGNVPAIETIGKYGDSDTGTTADASDAARPVQTPL